MAKIPYKKVPGKIRASAALVALLGLGAATLTLTTGAKFEGYTEEAYRCPAGVPTICFGNTKNVAMGQKETFEGCLKRYNAEVYEIASEVLRCLPELKTQPDQVKAAMVSMAYNIGSGAFCKSTIKQYAKEGDWERACKRMAEIYKVYTDPKTGKKVEAKGLVIRRGDESRLCLEGLEAENLPPELQ